MQNPSVQRAKSAEMRTKAIVFDLFGTLTSAPWGKFVASIERMASALNIDGPKFFRTWTKDACDQLNTGFFPSIRDGMLWVCKHNGVIPSEEGLAEAIEIRCSFTKSILQPRPDAVSTLTALRARGILIGLISDCTSEVPEIWQETPFSGLFDSMVFSCIAGIRKPNPAIYRMACDELSVLPSECVYIGDGYSNELSGAKAVGMLPFLILPPDEEIPRLESWEGSGWEGDVIPSLSAIPDILRGKPRKPDAGTGIHIV